MKHVFSDNMHVTDWSVQARTEYGTQLRFVNCIALKAMFYLLFDQTLVYSLHRLLNCKHM